LSLACADLLLCAVSAPLLIYNMYHSTGCPKKKYSCLIYNNF
jgi:hypothetical protein